VWVSGDGLGKVLFFVPSSIASRCCYLLRYSLLVAWCLSRVYVCTCSILRVRERERERGEIEVEEMTLVLDYDARIKLTIGTRYSSDADGVFRYPMGLDFDHHRGLLLVVDFNNHRVQVFSCDDRDDSGSFVSKFGEKGDQPGQFQKPLDLVIDHDHDRILITDSCNNLVQVWSLSKQSFLSCIGYQPPRTLKFDHRVQSWSLSDHKKFSSSIRQQGSGDLKFNNPHGIAIDKHHHRIIIADSDNNRLVFLSLIDLSFLFSVGKQGSQPGEFCCPSGIAIDHDRHRIIVADSDNNRVQVLSLIDGSFLFEFGSPDEHPRDFVVRPQGVCVDNQGRIIVADHCNYRLQAFTHEGHHISSFDCGYDIPWGVAFDEHRGLIAFSTQDRVHVIGANQWLPGTFTWRVDRHRYAPSWIKQAVSTMTMIRSVVDESSAMSMIPNELLFEIFSFLDDSPDDYSYLR